MHQSIKFDIQENKTLIYVGPLAKIASHHSTLKLKFDDFWESFDRLIVDFVKGIILKSRFQCIFYTK